MSKTRYTVIAADDPPTLARRVNELLEAGWELHGGLQLAAASRSGAWTEQEASEIYAQALVKRET